MYIKSADEKMIVLAEKIHLDELHGHWEILVNGGILVGSYEPLRAERVMEEIFQALEKGELTFSMPRK